MKLYTSLARIAFSLTLVVSLFVATLSQVAAVASIPAGIHILRIEEVTEAAELTQDMGVDDVWTYVTIPFTLADLDRPQEWQDFFDTAASKKMIPLVRLTTAFEDESWNVHIIAALINQIYFGITAQKAYGWHIGGYHNSTYFGITAQKPYGLYLRYAYSFRTDRCDHHSIRIPHHMVASWMPLTPCLRCKL